MTDAIARWGLEDFDCLDTHARTLELPTFDRSGGFGFAFWFWAGDLARRQEIIGSIGATCPWRLYLDHGCLVLHLGSPANDWLRVALTGSGWQRAMLVIDPAVRRVHLEAGPITSSYIPPSQMTIADDLWPDRLLVGGRTDPAGGHFDHTFGRSGSGLIDDLRLFAAPLTVPDMTAALLPDADVVTLSNSDALTTALSADPPGGSAPLDVRFTAEVDAQAVAPVTCLWEFGDGQRATGSPVTHRYAYAGAYSVRLRVIDSRHAQAVSEQTVPVTGQENPVRTVPVFVNGTEGYACYRIPSIVCAANGDLLAFAEARLESCSDSTRTIHIACKRSADGGATWSPLMVVAALDGFVCMNASPVVDRVHGTGRVIVVFRAADRSEWDIARGVGLSRALVVTSDDHGRTWSAPRDITAQVHHPYNPAYADRFPYAALPENADHDWRIQIPSQGHAIQLTRLPQTRGRLFFSGSLTRGDRSIFDSENYAFWSDDLGESWQIGGIIPRVGLNEAIAAELEDGSVLINTRAYTDQQPDGRRAVTRAHFDAAGAIHFDPTTHDEALIDPAVQASLLRCTWADQAEFGGRSRLLFSNPAHPAARVNLTVRLSEDEGATWAHSRVIERGPSAYSDLVMTADHQPGVLFERGNTGGIVFARFSLAWLEAQG